MSKASWLAAIFILTATPSFADRYISGNDLYPLCSAAPENVPGDQQADALRLQGTDKVADIGAGTGYFSVRIAKRVLEGKVFAVDIEPDMLRYLGERAHREHLSVLVPVRATADSSNIPELVDVVLVVDTYHHIDNRVSYFAKLRDSLVPNGRVAIIDFKLDAPEGPPPEFRLPPEKIATELAAAGYSLVETHTFLPRQYFLVFQRKGS